MSRVVRRVWALNAALLAAAAVLFFGIVVNLPPPSQLLVPWWALAGLFFISEIAVVHVQIRREANTFSLNELPLIAGLYFASPVGMVLAQALGAAIALAFHRRQPPLKLVFNVAKLSLEAAVAQVIFHWVVGSHSVIGLYGWLGGLAAIAVVDTLGCLVVQTVIALTEGRPKASTIRAVSLAVAGGVTSGSVALLGASVIGRDANGVWLLLIPAAMLFLAYRAYIGEQGRQEQIEQLYEANRMLQGAENLETAMMQLLEHVRTMFRADVVEIILLTSSGGEERAVCSRVGPDDDTVTMLDMAVDPMQQALAALPPETRGAMFLHARSAAGLPARLSALGVRDALVSPLGLLRVIGTIMVANRLGDVRSFNDKDRDLFDSLSRQIALSLENGTLMQALAGANMETARFEHQAFHDPLTQLANRDLFNDRVRHALAKRGEPGRTVAVMYLDLDDFKTVNDSLGHAAGDALLVQVAERLRISVRPDDTVARLGGDEFAILMVDITSEAEATAVAKRILDSLNTPFDIAGEVVWAHATIGIARIAPGQIDLPDLLRRADLAMYTAKGEGKGRYAIFGDRMRMSLVKASERAQTGAS
jgi:diguanylate cyclase (GGDEF)-like protein